MYSGYMRSGGCASCGVAPRTIGREQYTRSYYNGFNRYQTNNDYNRSNYNEDNYSNNITQSYVNNSRRLMTPPRNYSNLYSPTRYYSPNRNAGGCTECASNSAQNNYRSYSRPLTGNPLLRSTNNNIRYNMNRDLFNERNNNERFGNAEDNDNDNDNYTFKRSYVIPNSYNRNERLDNINMNMTRTKSPEFNIRRNLLNTRYRNYEENNNINNINERINRFNYSMNNNQYNNNIRSNLSNNSRISPSNNLYNSVSFNNDYKKFLENNMSRYGNNRTNNIINNNNNNNSNYNYKEEKNKLYQSPTPNFDYRRRNLDMSKRRYDYLRDSPEQEKNNKFEIPKYQNERFIDLNQYNYKSKLLQLIDERKTFFLFIFGSHDYTGKSWCSDCNIAKPIVEQGKRLIENKRYEKEIYFVSIPIDKMYKEDFRDDPFIQLERVPTLILFENGVEKGRLVENDLFSYSTIREFILQVYDTGRGRQYLYERRNYY